jgi:hypothetical protein
MDVFIVIGSGTGVRHRLHFGSGIGVRVPLPSWSSRAREVGLQREELARGGERAVGPRRRDAAGHDARGALEHVDDLMRALREHGPHQVLAASGAVHPEHRAARLARPARRAQQSAAGASGCGRCIGAVSL